MVSAFREAVKKTKYGCLNFAANGNREGASSSQAETSIRIFITETEALLCKVILGGKR
jgi:hypothetical protein